ncbi:MAG: hypothetical protein KJ587_20155 [Alphaproteobacteria bacterium]|nr:hypothetical protein [Alphaproteobacteria bacterium]
MFVSSDGSPLTEFTLKRPPSKLVDKARELRDSPVAQAYFVALRCIERVRYMEADTEEFNLKRVNATGQERIQVGQRGERWNKVLSDEMQDVLGPNVLAEMGLMVLDMFERREDENF